MNVPRMSTVFVALLAMLASLGFALGCSPEGIEPTPTPALTPQAPSSAALTTPRATDRFATAKGDLVITPLEQASILFGWDGKAIYVDPTATAIADPSLPKADIVLLTDAHFDHLDAVALSRVTTPRTVVVGPPSVAARAHVTVVLRNGDSRDVQGVFVSAVPMYGTQRGPGPGILFHPKGRGDGYVLDFGGERVYVSGDTECTPDVAALERIDVAFVAMQMPYAMGTAEAARCIGAFKPKVVFPYRYLGEDLGALEHALAGSGVELRERQFYPRPEASRLEAIQACTDRHWGRCEELLDRAKLLDPAGEIDPRVVRAREESRTQTLLPPLDGGARR